MRRSLSILSVVTFALVTLVTVSTCQNSSISRAPDLTPPSLGLSVWRESSFLDGGAADSFSLDTRASSDGLDVAVRVQGARGLKALYCELSAPQHALEVVSATPGELVGNANQALVLACPVPGAPERVHLGLVLANYPGRPGLTGDGVLATLKLRLKPLAPVARQVSVVPDSLLSAPMLIFEPPTTLKLYFASQGDYDENGEVYINDLTPLGANLGEHGPFDFKMALWCVDGDNNTELNINDITPIGSNYRKHLEGFRVYHSTSLADYPASPTAANGSGASEVSSQPLTGFSGSPGERKYVLVTIPEPGPTDIYWARAYEGSSLGTPSNYFQTQGTWMIQTVATGTPDPSEVAISLKVVNGFPAIAFYYDYDPWFIRATDEHGMTWGSVVQIMNDPEGNGEHISLAVISGVPAVAFYDDDRSYPTYISALDQDGATWDAPVQINGDYAWSMSLAEVNFRPAVAYYLSEMPGPVFRVMYERAMDAAGNNWSGGPVEIGSIGVDCKYASLQIVAGNPAVAFQEAGVASALDYVRSNDVNGTTWPTPSVIHSDSLMSEIGIRPVLRVVNGSPAICYGATSGVSGATAAYYVRAFNADGSGVWDKPLPFCFDIAATANSGQWTGMAAIGTQLYLAYYDQGNTRLMYSSAFDASGTGWLNALPVDSGMGNNVGLGCDMADINGHPAVAYMDATSESLKFAIFQ